MNQETGQGGEQAAAGAAAQPDSSGPASTKQVKVVSCVSCEGPVADNAGKCFACGSPLTGKEFPYIPRTATGPDIAGMVKWWAIFSAIAIALGGFSFGTGTSIALTIIAAVYGVKIFRAYFS